MTTLTEILNDPEVYYPGNFDTLERANALLTGLCQDAAIEIERLNKAVDDEREACALMCETEAANPSCLWEEPGCWAHAAENCAGAIRARGNT